MFCTRSDMLRAELNCVKHACTAREAMPLLEHGLSSFLNQTTENQIGPVVHTLRSCFPTAGGAG